MSWLELGVLLLICLLIYGYVSRRRTQNRNTGLIQPRKQVGDLFIRDAKGFHPIEEKEDD